MTAFKKPTAYSDAKCEWVSPTYPYDEENAQLKDENRKLRELVRDMQHAIGCLVVLGDAYVERYEDELCSLDDRISELGVEV